MKKNILIVVLCILLLGLSGYVVYEKILSQKNESDIIEKTSDKTNQDDSKIFGETDFNEIVTSWLGLSSLLNKNSLSEMTNQERLRMIINMYNGEDKYSTFSANKLYEIHQNSVIKKLEITYEDLYDYFGTFVWNTSRVGYDYDENNKTFTYTGALGHGGVANGSIAHREIVSLNKSGNTYTVKYRYVFFNNYDDGPSDVDIFLNIDDALNKKNVWKHLTVGEDYSTHMDEYIEEHYKEISNKLPIYTYIFKVEDGKLVITDFKVEQV